MEKSKIVEERDYDKEVDTLIKMGGQKALENQYKNISRRLDEMSAKNRELLKENDELKRKLDITVDGIEEILQLDFTSPIGFAKSLIEHKTVVGGWIVKTGEFSTKVPTHERVTFGYDELIEIAEYLLTYGKHNKEDL